MENELIYLRNILNDLKLEYGKDNISRYIDFYNELSSPIKDLFSFFHFQFNYYLKYLNARLKSGHYTANESRILINLIDDFKRFQSNLKETKYHFKLDINYQNIIDKCEVFLQRSGGSPIPPDIRTIEIVEIKPIFELETNISIMRDNRKFIYPTKIIGQGSYAKVFKYKDELYNRNFVIKRALNDLREDEYKRFKIEYEEMKKLRSPYVIEVYNFDEENQQYIMEYAEQTLDNFISKNNNKIQLVERINLVRQVLRAFTYIKNKGVLHRDISTTNILLKQYEELNIIKVADFGLVKLKNSNLTRKGTEIKGSLNDPKLELLGFDQYEIRHETYALTRLIYFIMTGKIKLDNYKNNSFKTFILNGINDDINKRYKTVSELENSFKKVVSTFF